MKWRLINTELADAATNMAIDEAIMLACGAGKVPPTLRLYGWRPAAVSLGYFQSAQDIDLAECQARGIDVVRRLTGGRAVLHDAEMTYSITVREGHPAVPRTIIASYSYFCGGLLAGLEHLGVAARMSMPRAAYGQKRKGALTAACFDASAQYEITAGGRKLAGSAQVRKNGVILQHGSILLQFFPLEAATVLQAPVGWTRDQLAMTLARRAISLAEILGRSVSWQEACTALTLKFGSALGVELEGGELTVGELAVSRQLARGKYSQDSWSLQR